MTTDKCGTWVETFPGNLRWTNATQIVKGMVPYGASNMAEIDNIRRRLNKRAKEADLDPAAWPAFLPLTLVKPYLRAMAAPDFDPLHTAVAISPLRRFWRIWRAARRGRL